MVAFRGDDGLLTALASARVMSLSASKCMKLRGRVDEKSLSILVYILV